MHKILKFREIVETDIGLLKTIFQNENIMKYAYDDCFSDDSIEEYLNKIISNNNSNDRKGFEYLIFYEKEFIGFCDLNIYIKNDTGGIAEIGYFIIEEKQGNGFGKFIGKWLVDLGFKKLKLHKIIAKCNANNIASWKLMESIGMTRESVSRLERYKHNTWVDEYKYSIINDEITKCV